MENNDFLPVRVFQISFHRHEAELSIGIPAVQRTLALWIKANPIHNLARLLLRLDMRHNNAGRIGFKWLDVIAIASLGDTDEGIHIMNPGRSNHVFESDPIIRNVFIANPHSIQTRETSDLDDSRV